MYKNIFVNTFLNKEYANTVLVLKKGIKIPAIAGIFVAKLTKSTVIYFMAAHVSIPGSGRRKGYLFLLPGLARF